MKTTVWQAFVGIILIGLLPAAARAETVELQAGLDATLIEHAAGALANGRGPLFFVGRTAQDQNSIRRAVLFFDVSAIPERAIIESVSLRLVMASSNLGPVTIEVHRLLADWGEGLSYGTGGIGAPSQPGDVTWIHRYYDRTFWVQPGGQFVQRVSASMVVDGPGPYVWESTNHLVQDVQAWLAGSQVNSGWILVGDETHGQTVRSFGSRENPDPLMRPVLTVVYRFPSE